MGSNEIFAENDSDNEGNEEDVTKIRNDTPDLFEMANMSNTRSPGKFNIITDRSSYNHVFTSVREGMIDNIGDEKEEMEDGRQTELPATTPSSKIHDILSSITSSPFYETLHRHSTRNFLRDEPLFSIGGMQLVEGVVVWKLIKFVMLTLILILIMHPLVRAMGWENDERYTIRDFISYDASHSVLDTITFYFVGRLYKRPGIDHIFPFLLPVFVSCIYMSWITNFRFLQHSVTLYEIKCVWPWQLFVYAIGTFFTVCIIIFLHIRDAIRECTVFINVIELILTTIIFLLPNISSPSLHLHHWYVMWLVGMHCNRDRVWSRIAQAICWGSYINGLAVYGRDPILGCEYSLFMSYSGGCKYLDCYMNEQSVHQNTTNPIPVVHTLDSRHCEL